MSFFLDVFKPAPHQPEIEDQEEVKQKYRYWRIRILYSTFIGYAFFYFTRKSFNFALPGLMADLHFDKSYLGLLGSILSLSYALSKFTSGLLSDKSNPRYFMAFGLMMTGVFNICFGLSSSFFFFALFWGLNGWFQGFGWPPSAKFLTHWYSQSERGSWWSSWNVSHNVGAATIPWISWFCLSYFNWRYAMYVPGVLCIGCSFFLLNRLRDTPQSIGLPPIEKFRNDYTGVSKRSQEGAKPLSTKTIFIDYVLFNKFIWILAAAYFFVYVVRTGIDWMMPLFFLEVKGYTTLEYSWLMFIFEIGGLCGSLTAGWSSDHLFNARRGPVNVLFSLGMLFSICSFWFIPDPHWYLDTITMFCIGFSIFGPQMLIGMTAAELSHKKAAATSTGFVGCFAYIGSAIAGYPLGKITQEIGWSGYFITLTTCAGFAALSLLPLWNVKENTQNIEPELKPELAKG